MLFEKQLAMFCHFSGEKWSLYARKDFFLYPFNVLDYIFDNFFYHFKYVNVRTKKLSQASFIKVLP